MCYRVINNTNKFYIVGRFCRTNSEKKFCNDPTRFTKKKSIKWHITMPATTRLITAPTLLPFKSLPSFH